MNRLFTGIATIALVGVVVAGATVAFYNDTETSTGNIFTAGSIDLKVDHLKQSYNGEDCTTLCSHWAVSVEEFTQGNRQDGSDVLLGRSNPTDALGPNDTSGLNPDVPFPTGFVSLGFGGSITLHFPDGIDDGPGDDIRIYEGTGGQYPDEQVTVEVSPNGSDWVTVDVDPSSITFDGTVEIDLDGDAPLVYYVRITDISNPAIHNSSADGFDLDAVEAIHCQDESTDGVPSDIWQCQLWEETDLDGSQSFFNFSDVKPGDWGRNVVSLHVFDNDAWGCLIVHDGDDDENTVYDPEQPDTDDEGELQDYINFFAWSDTDADGEYESGEMPIGQSTLGDLGAIAWYDSTNDQMLSATTTEYVGLAWCAGNISVNDTTISCDGAGMLNDAQSDIFSASLTAYAEQKRNNDTFNCANVDLGSGGGPSLTVADSYSTGFEPPTYATGNIDSQDSWSKSGIYDSEVVDDPIIDGLQSLRISNGYADGAFGGQTFASELSSGAGETGVGTENHFEAEFEISSTQLAEQPGLAISVSPDDGIGSRMSYLGFADEAGGIRVTFYDVTNAGPLPTTSTWNPTDLGLLDRSTSHTIKFVMDFVDGPSNDVVQIYIDGSLVHTGTSWEDYYRYDPEQSGNGNQLFPVDTLIFAARGASVPANMGQGFLFDNVSLLSGSY